MTPYERLMAEALPTGTFGHAQPPQPGPRPWTALEQAEHLRTLEEALNGWQTTEDRATRDRNRHRPAHLQLIPNQPDQTAA